MTAPGIYRNWPMADYLAIDALSATPARIAIDECAAAGWYASKLNAALVREDATEFDIGTCAHSLLLERSSSSLVSVDPRQFPAETTGGIPDGWTNKAIKAERDRIRASGKTPILLRHYTGVQNMVSAADDFLASLETTEPAIWRAFQPDGGESEVTMVWEDDGGLLCKLRTDRVSLAFDLIIDYKTTGASAEPSRWARSHMIGMGYYFGAAWYRRGITALTGDTPQYVFLAQETAPPHLCSLPGMDAETIALGDEKVGAAIKLWRECSDAGKWPGYPARVCYPPLPVYERMKWDERVIVTKDGIDYGSQA